MPLQPPFALVALVLPQHWHVRVCCYERWENDKPEGKHCDVVIVSNDDVWAEREAISRSGLPLGHKEAVTQCADKTHVEELDDRSS